MLKNSEPNMAVSDKLSTNAGDGLRQPLRILWVKIGGLWPLDSGGRLRSFHMLRELSSIHRVSVVTTHAPGEDASELRRQLPCCEQVVSLPFSAPKWRSPRFALTLARSWSSSLPVEMVKYRIPTLQREVRDLLDGGNFDLCVADFMIALPNIPVDSKVPVLFFAHNVDHLIMKRLSKQPGKAWMRPVLEAEWRKLRHAESRACKRAALTVTVSPEDCRVFQNSAPTAAIRSVPTGVDTTYFAPDGVAEKPLSLVFTGSMDYYPNEDGTRWFITDVLPRLQREIPDVELSIVGRNPSRGMQEVAARFGVKLTGRVEDVRPYVDEAAVYVVPLRIGGGTRLKIFEALAMAKAVVSTSIGAEGLPLRNGKHYVCADDAAQFADAVVALLRDRKRRRALGDAGQRLVREDFSWPQVARELERYCEAARQ